MTKDLKRNFFRDNIQTTEMQKRTTTKKSSTSLVMRKGANQTYEDIATHMH